MPAKKIPADDLGLPRFEWTDTGQSIEAFALTSHARARDALEFALAIDEPGFNVFVLGEDRSGRMTSTLEFLQRALEKRPPANDWVYLDNFRRPHRPKPYRLPAGVGRRFRDRMAALLPELRDALTRAFTSEGYQTLVRGESDKIRGEATRRLEALRGEAQSHGLDLVQTEQGAMVVAATGAEAQAMSAEERQRLSGVAKELGDRLAEINRWVVGRQMEFMEWHRALSRQVADQAVSGLLDALIGEFQTYGGLARWLTEMRVDILDNLPRFHPQPPEVQAALFAEAERRYTVNLLVDHGDDGHPSVVLEANPTYENLFGRIDYRQVQGALQTDFTLIQAGSLHRANGGILVLRAEALAANPVVWFFLKGALRDRAIQVEELHRAGGVPIAGAPRPKPIPLDVKVVMIGHPRWYYTFFALDPDFQTHFRVKADIDADLEANAENLGRYAALIRRMADDHGRLPLADAAITQLLGVAARWAGERDKLTARFELIEDLVGEASLLARRRKAKTTDVTAINEAIDNRRRRNARVEDRVQEAIAKGLVIIDVKGEAIGQVNALTVREVGDHVFGAPSRVTARASVGRRGVINIERDVALGGPIQQKGAMVIQGWMAGRFARRCPLSFNVSVTFEQSYGGVEGDSASLAELIAILSDLAAVPTRQDLAVTGSVNQLGQAQAVGGVRHKIEGFFRACVEAGRLTGTQGVVIPSSTERHLVLRDEIAAAVADGRFHVYSVDTVEAALELFTGVPAGAPDAEGNYPETSIYGRVMAQIETFDRLLKVRLVGEE